MKHVRTGIVVVLVTLLVWVFAENESLRTQPLEVSVRLEATREDRLLTPASGAGREAWDGGVRLVVEGSVASVERLRTQVIEGVTLRAGEQLQLQEGDNSVDLATALQRHRAFAGVTVREAEPRSLDVRVDTLEEIELPVAGVAEDVELTAAPSPGVVRVRAPRRLIEALPDGATAQARLTPAMLASAPEGRLEVIPGVRVFAPEPLGGRPGVTITPPAVDVSVTLRSRSAFTVLATTPVHVRLPAAELGDWDVSIVGASVLRDVRVSGPKDLIERIERNELPVVATVTLTFEDLERGIESKAARFTTLPTPLQFEVEDPTVRLEIRRRDAPAGEE